MQRNHTPHWQRTRYWTSSLPVLQVLEINLVQTGNNLVAKMFCSTFLDVGIFSVFFCWKLFHFSLDRTYISSMTSDLTWAWKARHLRYRHVWISVGLQCYNASVNDWCIYSYRRLMSIDASSSCDEIHSRHLVLALIDWLRFNVPPNTL